MPCVFLHFHMRGLFNLWVICTVNMYYVDRLVVTGSYVSARFYVVSLLLIAVINLLLIDLKY